MPVHADIVVFVALDRVARQDRVAMMARRVDRVAAVGVVRPQRVRQELILRGRRPGLVPFGMVLVFAQDFLQEHHIRRRRA
ncbi:hypothetical protein D3C87_2077170 [compost metagenome]